jgi:hypothetical protein
MNPYVPYLCCLGIMLWAGLSLPAQDTLRTFDEAWLEARQATREYQYGPEPATAPGIKGDIQIDTQTDTKANAQANTNANTVDEAALERWKWLMYAAIGIGLSGLAWLLFRRVMGRGNRNLTNSTNADLPDPDDIRTFEVEPLLHMALEDGDYRRAVRLQFLGTLQVLTQQHYIDWRQHKTNHDYLLEMPTGQRKAFAELLRAYEYVWYGEFGLSQGQYRRLDRQFQAYLSRL